MIEFELIDETKTIEFNLVDGGSGGGTGNYNDLTNKPQINNVELIGNKSLNDLGIQPKGNYVVDTNYVHTDNNYTTQEKNKLSTLENYDDTEVKQDIADLDTNKADKSEIPTLSNYYTKTQVDGKVNFTWDEVLYPTVQDTIEFIISEFAMALGEKQNVIDNSNKLPSDFINDTNQTNKFVTSQEKTTWNNKVDQSDLDNYATQADFQTVKNNINTEKARIDKLNTDLDDVVSYVDEVSESVPTQLSQLSEDSTHRVVTDTEKTTWNSKYNKPSTGIPKTDLANDVQTSLGKADSAIQSHQDISGKLDTSKVKNANSTTAGDVYDVRYINNMIGNIESLLSEV